MVSKKQQKNIRRRKLVNFVGALAYLSVVIQWIMAVTLFAPLISEAPLLNPEPVAVSPVESSAAASANDPSIFTFIGIAIIVLIMIALTAYVLAKMPATLARTGRKVVKDSSSAIVTVAIKAAGKKDGKRLREKLTPKIVFIMKVAVVLLPILLSFLSRYLEDPILSQYLALYLSVMLANGSFLLFIIQYGMAYFLGVKRADIW